MPNLKTLVLGASPNPTRYAYLATQRLDNEGYTVIPLGIKEGKIGKIDIVTKQDVWKNVHTITIYLSAERQKSYYEYILSLNPQRLIFNPGAENLELVALAQEEGIETIEACTLVMLSVGNYDISENE